MTTVGDPPTRGRVRGARAALVVAAVAGLVHAAVSLYWGLGGSLLLETLGERIVTQFADARWLLLVVATVKAAGALVPLWLAGKGRLAQGLWRRLAWLGAATLLLWGGLNTVVGNLVLLGFVRPDGGYDRAAMLGHAWLWDPLFLVWGVALAVALVRSRPGVTARRRRPRRRAR